MITDQPFGIARTTRYDDFTRDFRWDVPATFNFATDVVDAWAAAGDPLALITENAAGDITRYKYSDISRESARLADVLLRSGVTKGDRVILMMPRIALWPIAMTACHRIGAIVIPCIEMLTPRDIEYRVENSGAKAAICRAHQAGKFAAVADRLTVKLALGAAHIPAPGWRDLEAECASAATDVPAATIAAEDPVVMYYTSGSTGHPKGVLHAARALYAWRMAARYWLDLAPGDRIWCTADTGWSKSGTSVYFGPFSSGATSLMYDGPFEPAERLRLLSAHGITVYCAPATELNRVVDENVSAYDLSRLRRTVSAGEAMNPAVADRWRQAVGHDVEEAYGLTEALMIVLNYPSEPLKIGSMGRPSPGSDVDIIDDAGRRLPAGEAGHIAVRMPNPQAMLGYWQDPERTESVYLGNAEGRWFVTGDRGHKDTDGYIWYGGRADDIISSAGYRIGPLEVENALLEHDAVLECAVVGSPDPERGEIVKAFVVLRPGYAPDDELTRTLQEHAKATTAPYKYPRAIAYVPDLPKTITGKIRRRALRDQEYDRNGKG
ncbi:MAG: AMP-binding protein [Hyphomicrobiaceae bacterium]|nr:AMP-binding protein [Hyphomicrobiaceae bacterium]